MFDCMERWVERQGHHVEFGNILGTFVGQSYKFRCATIEGAVALEAYLKQRDPANDKMPVGITDEEAAEKFGAVAVKV